MPTIETGGFITSSVASERTTPQGLRRIFSVLFPGSSPGQPNVGIIANGTNPLQVVANASAMEYQVRAGYAMTARSGRGGYIVGTPSQVTVTTDVGHGTFDRWDVIYIVQPDPELSETGVARIDVAKGTPSATPAVPAIPTGALELGRKLVPAGASNTSTGSAIVNQSASTGLQVAWANVSGKPTTFTPAAHTHSISEISDLATQLAAIKSTADAAAAKLSRYTPNRITVQPASAADPTTGNTTGDLLIEF